MIRWTRYLLTLMCLVAGLSYFPQTASAVEGTEIEIGGTIGGGTTEPPKKETPAVDPKEEYAQPKEQQIELNRLPQLGNQREAQKPIGEWLFLIALMLIIGKRQRRKQKSPIN